MKATNIVACNYQMIEDCFACENHVLELLVKNNEGDKVDYPLISWSSILVMREEIEQFTMKKMKTKSFHGLIWQKRT